MIKIEHNQNKRIPLLVESNKTSYGEFVSTDLKTYFSSDEIAAFNAPFGGGDWDEAIAEKWKNFSIMLNREISLPELYCGWFNWKFKSEFFCNVIASDEVKRGMLLELLERQVAIALAGEPINLHLAESIEGNVTPHQFATFESYREYITHLVVRNHFLWDFQICKNSGNVLNQISKKLLLYYKRVEPFGDLPGEYVSDVVFDAVNNPGLLERYFDLQ